MHPGSSRVSGPIDGNSGELTPHSRELPTNPERWTPNPANRRRLRGGGPLLQGARDESREVGDAWGRSAPNPECWAMHREKGRRVRKGRRSLRGTSTASAGLEVHLPEPALPPAEPT